jgi:hypothetical protein
MRKNHDIPIVDSDRVGCTACVCSLEMGGDVGVLCGPTPGSPRARMLPFKPWGNQFPPSFFCFALSRFLHPLPQTVWLRNEGTAQHTFMTTVLRRFLCHSQSDDVPYDASPFINHIPGPGPFRRYIAIPAGNDRSGLLYRQCDQLKTRG